MIAWLIENTAVAAVLAALVTVSSRVWKLRPSTLHALWVVVLAKLVFPPVLGWPWGSPLSWEVPPWETKSRADLASAPAAVVGARDDDEEPPSHEASSEDGPELFVDVTLEEVEDATAGRDTGAVGGGNVDPVAVELEEPVISSTAPGAQSTSIAPDPGPSAARSSSRPWMPVVSSTGLERAIVGLWLTSVVAMAIVQLRRIVRFRRRIRSRRRVPREIEELVLEVSSELSVRPPPCALAAGIASPLVWSLGRSWLLLPETLPATLPSCSLRCVVIHELAHLRRRDHLVGWLVLVAECVWWWNPLFRHVRRQIHENAELACDAWVVSALPRERRTYARTLIGICESLSDPGVPVPSVGMGNRVRDFERRLTMILHESTPARTSLLGTLCASLLALVAFPAWSQESSPNEIVPEPTRPSDVKLFDLAGAEPPSSPQEPAALPQETPSGPAAPPAWPDLAPGDTATPPGERSNHDRLESRLDRLERSLAKLADELSAMRRQLPGSSRASGSRQLPMMEPNDALPPERATSQSFPVPAKRGANRVAARTSSRRRTSSSSRSRTATTQQVIPSSTGRSSRGSSRYAPGGLTPGPERQLHDGFGNPAQDYGTDTRNPYAVKVERLVRTTYRLPGGKARALATFLKENVSAKIALDVSVGDGDGDGDGSLVVTAEEEVHRALSGLIALVIDKPPTPSTFNLYPAAGQPPGSAPPIQD